jgi:hypothetical protein
MPTWVKEVWTPQNLLWAHTTRVGVLTLLGDYQLTPALWGLFLLRVLVWVMGFFLLSLSLNSPSY